VALALAGCGPALPSRTVISFNLCGNVCIRLAASRF
jgi:hypothetical protein